jgi:hypothetical protein
MLALYPILEPVPDTKENTVIIYLRRPRIKDLDRTQKGFKPITKTITGKAGFLEPIPCSEKVVRHIGKVGRKKDVVLWDNLIIQPTVRLDIAVAREAQKVISEKWYKVVHKVVPKSSEDKIK